MARSNPIGHLRCPLCDLEGGEVKRDKNGNPYFFCPECTVQILTHGGRRGELLLAKAELLDEQGKVRPITSTEEAAAEDQPAEKSARRRRTMLGRRNEEA